MWSYKGHMVIKTKHSAQHLMFHEPSGARTLWARSVLYFWFAKQHFGLQSCPWMLEIWAQSLPRWSRELRKYLYGCQSQQLAELHTEFLKSRSSDTGKRLGTRLLIASFASIHSCEQPLVLVPPTSPKHSLYYIAVNVTFPFSEMSFQKAFYSYCFSLLIRHKSNCFFENVFCPWKHLLPVLAKLLSQNAPPQMFMVGAT